MTEADQNKAVVQQAIELLTESNSYLEALDNDMTEIGADLNAIRPHVDNAMRKTITALSKLRDGNNTAARVLIGTTGMVSESLNMLAKADEDLEDMVKALNVIKQYINDIQTGPYRTQREQRPRIVGRINAAIARLRGYWTTL